MAAHGQLIPGGTEADLEVLAVTDILVVCELLRLGYAAKSLYRVWRGMPPMKSDTAVTLVRDALKVVGKTEATEAASWLIDHFDRRSPDEPGGVGGPSGSSD